MKQTVPVTPPRASTRLAGRKRVFEILFLTIIFVIVIFVSSVMAVRIHNRSSENYVSSRAYQTAKRFSAYIQRTLILVQKAAKSKAIKAWFSDEGNPEKRENAYYEMLDYSSVLSNPHLYFGIADSLGDFSFRPGTTLDEFVPYKKLDPDEPWDSWYFKCAASGREYVFNFDKDLDTRIWKLWLNHKVEADSKLAGVFCAAFEINDLRGELFDNYDPDTERCFIIDGKGGILMSNDSAEYYPGEETAHIFEVCKDPAFRSLLGKALADNEPSSPRMAALKSAVVPFRYNAFMKIPETDWTVVVVFDSDYLTGFAGMTDFLPLPLALLLSLIVYAIVSSLHTARFVFSPLARLTESIAGSETVNVKIYGHERTDEIGGLSRAIRESRSRLNSMYMILREVIRDKEEQERLLFAVNKTASILLASPDDEEKFGDSIREAMGAVGNCLNLDRVRVWKTETVDNVLRYVPKHEWRSDIYEDKKSVFDDGKPRCFDNPVWNEKFARGECINGPVRNLTEPERDILKHNNLKSVLLIPIHLRKTLWGFVTFGDCRNERAFDDDEINILRSAGMMMVSAIEHNSQAAMVRQANEQVQLMLDAAPFAVTMWDKNFRVVDCSQSALDVFGYSSKQELMEHFVDNAPEYQPDGRRSLEILAGAAAEAFRTGSCRLEWTGPAAGGDTAVFEDTAVRVKYRNEFALMLYSRDIREEKKMLAELAEHDKTLANQAHWYKSLLDGIPLAVSVTDADMNITFSNKASAGVFNMSRDELIGKHCSIRNCPMCNTPDCSIVRVKRGFNQTFFRQNGLSYKVDSEIIRDLAGETLGYLEVMHDITEVENMARRQADAANEAKTVFLANMSHEMRTPLNAIMGLSELTLSSAVLDEEARSNLIKMHNAGATLVSTVNDILDISKIEAGKFELVPIEYELPSLVNDAIIQNAARIEEKPIKFILDIEKELPMRLFGDELRIKEILNNLLSNAFKYTRKGTVELGMRCEREGEDVWLSAWVKDTGIGIRAEDIEKLFDDYVQLDKKSNRKIQGTGLGLAITKRLVELMDGTISVESGYEKGSVFTVRVRQKYVSGETIGPDMVQNLKNFRYIERKRRQNLRRGYLNMAYARVLVVDDIATNLDVARGMLKPYGMKVDCVTSGQEAVDAIREEKVKYNAVFMDHMMPGMDGIEAVRIIRNEIESEYAKTIPVIALTANAISGNEKKFLKAGFQAFISKPIELARLDSAVRQWVRDKEQEKLLDEKQINTNAEPVQHTRTGKYRRRTDRRSGIDRRIFGTNVAGLDLAKGMERFGNDREIYLDVLNSFAVNTRPLLDRIREGAGAAGGIPLTDYAVIVHGIKGSSRGIGALTLGDKAEELEHAAKKGDSDFVAAGNNGFIAAAEQLIAGIEESLAGQKRENPRPKKEKPDGETLEKLLAACRDYDMDGADAAIAEIGKWEYEAGGGLAAWLKENVDLMNFTEVEEKLSALLNGGGQGGKNVTRAI